MKGLVTDIATGDLLVEKGGAVIADSEVQVVENVLLASRGDFKEHPLVGAETRQQLSGEKDVMWPTQTKKMIKECGVEVRKVSMADDGTVTIE
ncbi:MAG TPA: hypothetical protein H9937_04205 [Candidatus Alistipes stercorigallinarum]|nr:hypothetical protein [Candidatus Alistipes stercorigallinarum]